MSITFKTSDSLIRLGLLPISLFEVLLLLSGTCEFPFIIKFPTVLELQEFAEILCKVSNIFLDDILIDKSCASTLSFIVLRARYLLFL